MKILTMVLVVSFILIVCVFGWVDNLETAKYSQIIDWLSKVSNSENPEILTMTKDERKAFNGVNWTDSCVRLNFAVDKAGKKGCYVCLEYKEVVYVYVIKNGKVLRFNPELPPFFFYVSQDEANAVAIKKNTEGNR